MPSLGDRRAILNKFDKKNHKAILTLMACLRNLPSENPTVLLAVVRTVLPLVQPSFLPQDEWRRALSILALDVCKCLHQLLVRIHLRELKQLGSHLDYWRSALKLPWLVRVAELGSASSNEATIQHYIRRLVRIETTWVCQLGRLHLCAQEMDRIMDFRDEVDSYVHYVRSIHLLISGEQAEQMVNPSSLLKVLQKALRALPEFEEWFEERIRSLAPPPVLRRVVPKLAVVAAAALVGAGVGRARLPQLRVWGAELVIGTWTFIQEHVAHPLLAIVGAMRAPYQDRTRAMVDRSRRSLQASQESLESMLIEYGQATGEVDVAPRASQLDMNLVMNTYGTEIQRPVANAVRGHLIQGALIQTQKLKVDTEAIMVSLDQLLKSNEVNFQLLAIIPALVLGLAAAHLLGPLPSRLLGAVWHTHTDKRRARGLFRKQLRLIDLFLIAHLEGALDQQTRLHGPLQSSLGSVHDSISNADSINDSMNEHGLRLGAVSAEQAQQEREQGTGRLLVLLDCALGLTAGVCAAEEEEPLLKEDLSYLAMELSVEQKLFAIRGIYRRYNRWL